MTESHHHFRRSRWFPAAAVLFLFAAVVSVASADPWSFAVAGDDRTDLKALAPDPTGINTKILKNLLHAIDEKKPKFLLFTVDLVVGENPRTSAKLAEQFSFWTNLVQTEAPDLTVLP